MAVIKMKGGGNMAVYAYDPNLAKQWSNDIVGMINGGSISINEISRKFSEQLEVLVQPNVWTGAAAKANYLNFLDTHQNLINFSNQFGQAFSESMNEVNRSVANLEEINLGVDSNVATTFGALSFDRLTELSEANVSVDAVRYDYGKIASIGQALDEISRSLSELNSNLSSKISLLNDGSGMWDGNSAEAAKDKLNYVLNSNMPKITESLSICIKNISEAAANAQAADRV